MLRKLLVAVACVLFLATLFFPRWIPRLLRKLGLWTGNVGRAGQEILTGEEAERSPLARYETKVGEIVARRLMGEHGVPNDAQLQAKLEEIGVRLSAQATRRQIRYRFSALASAEPNAFAVPGGWIFITQGMVALCGGDADLIAGVLAHEVVHVDRRHALLGRAANAALRTGLRVFLLGKGALFGRLAQGVEQLLTQGYRQDQELEADLLGARLARRAGFDPGGLGRVLELVRQASPDGQSPLAEVLQYFRSHPPIAERLQRLREGLSI